MSSDPQRTWSTSSTYSCLTQVLSALEPDQSHTQAALHTHTHTEREWAEGVFDKLTAEAEMKQAAIVVYWWTRLNISKGKCTVGGCLGGKRRRRLNKLLWCVPTPLQLHESDGKRSVRSAQLWGGSRTNARERLTWIILWSFTGIYGHDRTLLVVPQVT